MPLRATLPLSKTHLHTPELHFILENLTVFNYLIRQIVTCLGLATIIEVHFHHGDHVYSDILRPYQGYRDSKTKIK